MRPVAPLTAEAVARLQSLADRTLGAEEFRALQAVPIGDAEMEESRALIRWFRRRYPTPAERLAYVRRSYSRWARSHRPPRP